MTKLGMGLSLLSVVVLAGIGFLVFRSTKVVEKPLITNFEECAKAGYPIMESYPAQCRVPGGELFVQVIDNPIIPPKGTGDCYVGGCSGEICSDQKDMASACIYRDEFACYKGAKCERQTNGACGWTQTSALLSCLNPSSKTGVGYVSGHVTIGPNCPVERVDQPCLPSPEAYTSRAAVIFASNGTTEKTRKNLDTQGNFTISLSPGNYLVQIQPAGIGAGEKKPVTIKSSKTSVVNFDIDTGIR